ncbi:MAG: hypothetical protein PQJ59_15440 [Spirochaetales bacterium]|nr:hypothetical protein [Spirochaetales bacterium]
MKIKAHTFFAALLLLFLFSALLFAEETSLSESTTEEGETGEIQEEAPSHIWSYSLDDSNVDFYWDGYWRFTFSAGLAFSVDEGSMDWSSTYSDYTDGFFFEQAPDLLLSLWIDDRYFLETSVVEDYDYNTYLVGYQGADDEYLQSVKIGNTDITTDSYAGLSVSSPEYNTPGLTIKGETEKMQNEFMVRFDGTWEDSKTYIGSFEADEEYFELYDYLENRKFVLPDSDVESEDLLVYIQDDDGDYDASTSNYSYRLAEEGDYLLDSEKGILTIEDDEDGPIAVFYTVGTYEIGADELGDDSIIPPTGLDTGIPDVDGTPEAFTWTTEDPYDTLDRNWNESRLESIDGNDCLLIYEPDRFSPFAVYSRYSYSQSLSSDSWRNDLNLVDRNGDETDTPDDFSWEADTSDNIITLYRSDSDDRDALNRYPLGDTHPEVYGNAPYNDSDLVSEQLQLITKNSSSGYTLGSGVVAGSVSITVNGESEYNYSLDGDTGEITFNRYIFPDDRIVISYRQEALSFEGQEMLIYQGNRFTLSEKDKIELAASFNWVFPDGTDYSTPDGGTLSLGTTWDHTNESFSLTTELVGEADLGDADGLQSVMGMEDALSSYPVYEEALAEPKAGEGETDNDYDEADYIVMNDGDGPLEADSTTAYIDDYMLESVFTLEDGEWTGADLHLTSSGTADYSTLQEVRFYVQVPSGTPGDIVLKLGEVGEYDDFDDDDTIEDYDDSLVATHIIDAADLSSSWTQVTWELDSDDRQCLSATRSLRFIFANGGTTGDNYADDYWEDGNSTVYLGEVEFVGQTFAMTLNSSETDAEVSQSEEDDDDLESAYSDEIDQFHSDDSDQRVAKISWSGLDTSDDWEAVSWIDAQDPREFGKLIFFVKTEDSTGTFTMELTDTDYEGITLSWEADGTVTDWQKVTIDLSEERATFDEGAQNISLDIDSGVTSVSRVFFSGTGSSSGTFYVDELYFEESILALNGKATVNLEYDREEILTGAKGFKWLANYSLDLSTYASATGRNGGMADDEGSLSFDGLTGVDIMYLGVGIQGDGSYEDGTYALWGGHSLEFPTADSPVVVEESFALGDDSDSPLLSHTASATVKPTGRVTLTGDHEAVLEQEELEQEWSAELNYSGEKWKSSLESDWSIESDEEEKHNSGYFTVWADSWTYFIPDETEVDDRATDGDFSLTYKGERFSPSLDVSLSTDLDYSSDWEQTSELDTTLSLPISFGGSQNITLTPEYSRTLSVTEEEDYSGSFSSDYENWGKQVGPVLPLTHFIPFWELADSADVMNTLPEEGTYSYTPELGLTLTRNYGSSTKDLYLPSLAQATFSRLYEGETDSRYFKNTWDFTLQQRALNLFGSFGVKPTFDFYTTEEIANSFTLSFEEKNDYYPAGESFSWNSYTRFQGEGGSSFNLENDLTYDFDGSSTTEQLSLSYDWDKEREPYRKIPLSQYILDKESYVANSEELSYEFSYDDEDDWSHEIGLTHESTLYIDDLGTLEAWFKAGVEVDETETTLGSEVGVELTLTF